MVLIGADRGIVDGGKKTASPGPIAFARSLPLDKALSGAVLLAYAMNGEPLTPEHGAPLRAVVGGWYGMAWIKWLTEIHVVDAALRRLLAGARLFPLGPQPRRADAGAADDDGGEGADRAAGRRHAAAAWPAGAGHRRRLERGGGASPTVEVKVGSAGVATGAGCCRPTASSAGGCGSSTSIPTEVGRTPLRCRASDEAGSLQPDEQHTDRESYGANWIVPVEVEVVDGPRVKADDFVI